MFVTLLQWIAGGGAILCFLYYMLALFSARRFFTRPRGHEAGFTPPVSILKPVRGLDREAYENFASFCRQEYSQYEILFGVTNSDDPAVPVIRKLIEDFPHPPIRLVIGSTVSGTNDKVAKLCRLVHEARHDVLAVSDSDIRVEPEYLKTVVAPLRDSRVGAVTCTYRALPEPRLGAELEAVGVTSDFFAGVVTDWQLEGVKFAFGSTIVVTRQRLAEIGGFEALRDSVGDDFQLGRRIASKGYRVELLPYTVTTTVSGQTVSKFIKQRLRWMVVLRHCSPWGHLGMALTQALPWSLAAAALSVVRQTGGAAWFLGAYLILRLSVAWEVGVRGLKDPLLRRKLWLAPVSDAISFLAWIASFASDRIEWRGHKFRVRKGRMLPVTQPSSKE